MKFLPEYDAVLETVRTEGILVIDFKSPRQAQNFRLKYYAYLRYRKSQATDDQEELTFLNDVTIRYKDNQIELTIKPDEAEKGCLQEALARGFSIPIHSEDV